MLAFFVELPLNSDVSWVADGTFSSGWLTASKSTRTFSDFETVGDAMNGICQLYEQRLKQMNPGMSSQSTRSLPDPETCAAMEGETHMTDCADSASKAYDTDMCALAWLVCICVVCFLPLQRVGQMFGTHLFGLHSVGQNIWHASRAKMCVETCVCTSLVTSLR